MMNNLKLGVEVVSAHDLMPKDSEGAANAYVELHFDGQRFRTTVKERDLNPYWNESFYFNVSDPASLPEMALEAWVYHIDRVKNSKSFLGKVRIAGTSFVNISDATVLHYPLEKRGIFSRVKGELGLKVFLTDDPTVRISDPVAEFDNIMGTPSEASNPIRENQYTTNMPTRTFQHLPRDNHTLPQQYQQQMQQQQPYYTSGSMPPPPLEVPGPSQYPLGDMRQELPPQQPRILRMFSSSGQQPVDYQLKETSPTLGGGQVVGGRVISRNKPGTYDLVEQMQYLFVRVVKARDLPAMDVTGSLDPYVEVKLGNYKLQTRYFNKTSRPEWDEVFAFPRERMQASVLEVRVKDKDLLVDDFVGRVLFDLNEVPVRVPPDSPLAPEWYRLQDKDGDKRKGELMLAVWIGTQADEAFPSAHHADSIPIDPAIASTHIRGKVYPAPRLWYLRVGIIEAQDVLVPEKSRLPEVFVKLRLGNQIIPTRVAQSRNANFQWNEEHMLVAAEPFEEDLTITIEDRHNVSKDEVLGYVHIPLSQVPKRGEDRMVRPQWYPLKRQALIDLDLKEDKFSSRIHLKLSLDGGYHVLDEATQYASDLRPTMKQLWKPPIGVLELGILNINGLHPMKTRDGRGTCDAYCVAKYGQKWVRTRTIVDNLGPRFNEQYTWDVHDHATVLTVGVFDNCQLAEKSLTNSDGHSHHKDHIIGKVRIRLSTLEAGRVYTHTYPLLVLHGSGVKKMGELHLAIRFTVTSLVNSLYVYTRPLLPKMHYLQPLSIVQQERLRYQAVQIVAARLSRAEPPLRKEVVEFMSDAHAHLFSMRRSKANFFRLMSVLSGPLAVGRWLSEVCAWKNPVTTVLVHVLHVMLVCYPELILPTIFLYMFLIGLWNYRYRPRYPPHMNTKLSHADSAHPDELDEEFDTFPTSRGFELIRMRYDRLRHVAGRVQTVVGDVATQGERIQSLLSWRDPRATAVFLLFCIIAAITLYVTPTQVLAVLSGFYMMRHPRFRRRLPALPMNFFRRLPARTDSLL